MQNTIIKSLHLFVILFLSAFIFSCSLERKIAKSYVKKNDKQSVLLFFPTALFKTNLKTYLVIPTDSLQFLDEDSVLNANSLFLQFINDSVFLAKCKQSMIKEFSNYGIKVYEYDQMDEFMNLDDSSYVITLAQMQLEEYIQEEVIDNFDFESSSSIDLNRINLNTWFELKRNLVPDEKYPILYSSYMINDGLRKSYASIYFQIMLSRSIINPYKIDTIGMADVYNLAELAGKNYAINFYDYLLNIYVQDHLPKNQYPKFYFHYNRRGKNLHTVYYDDFTEIDP